MQETISCKVLIWNDRLAWKKLGLKENTLAYFAIIVDTRLA
jgi:hypothetical protein